MIYFSHKDSVAVSGLVWVQADLSPALLHSRRPRLAFEPTVGPASLLPIASHSGSCHPDSCTTCILEQR
jgi:hypothetical protein